LAHDDQWAPRGGIDIVDYVEDLVAVAFQDRTAAARVGVVDVA
jgi:hypothetical protein